MTELLEWVKSYEDSPVKPTYTNMKEKIWQLLPKEKTQLISMCSIGSKNPGIDPENVYLTKHEK